MSDLELLFLVLGIIYVWECGWWAKRGSIGFRTWLGKSWALTQPSRLLGNQTSGLVLAHPLPPLGTLLTCHVWPLSISPDAVLSYVPPSVDAARRIPGTGTLFRWDGIKRVEAKGKKVQVDGKLLVRAASPSFGSFVAAKLEIVRQASKADRKRIIERIVEESFDTKKIQRRWQELLESSAALRFATNFLFFYLFGFVPLTLWRLSLSRTWVWLLVGLLCCTLSIAVQFYQMHKRLFLEAEDERFTHFIIVLLSPASALRAHDLLSRTLLEAFHPLGVAQVFCSRPAFKRLAEDFLRELRYPISAPHPEPLAQTTERYARELLLNRVEKFLRSHGVHPEELLAGPPRSDPGCLSFCPRCHAQFTLSEGACPDCGSVQLLQFSSPAERGEAAAAK